MSELNGILLVDKPAGITSHGVVGRARRVFNTKAIGHCGTLDPMASGLLILLIGNATKLSDYLLTQDKTYQTTVQLGVSTDSYDITGKVTQTSDKKVSNDEIQKAIGELTGEIDLEIPIYSAKKVNGKKLYELAREEKSIDLPRKIMNFFNLKILNLDAQEVNVELSCSKGSFIRAWGHELGKKLGTGGTLKALRRTVSAPYRIENAIALEDLETLKLEVNGALAPELLGKSFIASAQALPHLKMLVADHREQKLLSNGQIPHTISTRLTFELKQAIREKEPLGVRVVGSDRKLLAILQAMPEKGLKIRRVFKP